jgi:hypothetical protein
MQANGTYTDELHELQAGWAADAEFAKGDDQLTSVVRDARCYDAVMWFVHHLTAASKTDLVASGVLTTLPMLPAPTTPRTKEAITSKSAPPHAVEHVVRSFVSASGCAACHVNNDPQPTTDCSGSPDGKCPVWPREFSAPFALHASLPPIGNASSTFYYKFDADPNGTRAQLVDYSTRCFPFVSAHNFFESKPCKLLFLNSGIYLMQPSLGIDCCTFAADVGAVPPNFLRAYAYQGESDGGTVLLDSACPHFRRCRSDEDTLPCSRARYQREPARYVWQQCAVRPLGRPRRLQVLDSLSLRLTLLELGTRHCLPGRADRCDVALGQL